MVAFTNFVARFLVLGLTLGVLVAGCGGVPPTVPFEHGVVYRDLTYCRSQLLDLFIPHGSVDPRPLAVYIHGGGMTTGDKSDLNPVFLESLASAGYAVASVNYRLAPASRFPAQLRDVKCAIRYLRSKATKYGLNTNEFFAFGTSVGGQLAALMALTGSHSVWDVGPYPTESSGLRAAADFFGPANLTEPASGFSPSGIQEVFGTTGHRALLLASPTHFVHQDAPPILLVQGVDDTKVLETQSVEFFRDLKAKGDLCQLLLVQNMGHMFVQVGPKALDPSLRQIAHETVAFFQQVTDASR